MFRPLSRVVKTGQWWITAWHRQMTKQRSPSLDASHPALTFDTVNQKLKITDVIHRYFNRSRSFFMLIPLGVVWSGLLTYAVALQWKCLDKMGDRPTQCYEAGPPFAELKGTKVKHAAFKYAFCRSLPALDTASPTSSRVITLWLRTSTLP